MCVRSPWNVSKNRMILMNLMFVSTLFCFYFRFGTNRNIFYGISNYFYPYSMRNLGERNYRTKRLLSILKILLFWKFSLKYFTFIKSNLIQQFMHILLRRSICVVEAIMDTGNIRKGCEIIHFKGTLEEIFFPSKKLKKSI